MAEQTEVIEMTAEDLAAAVQAGQAAEELPPRAGPLAITPDDLFTIIGRLYVETVVQRDAMGRAAAAHAAALEKALEKAAKGA